MRKVATMEGKNKSYVVLYVRDVHVDKKFNHQYPMKQYINICVNAFINENSCFCEMSWQLK